MALHRLTRSPRRARRRGDGRLLRGLRPRRDPTATRRTSPPWTAASSCASSTPRARLVETGRRRRRPGRPRPHRGRPRRARRPARPRRQRRSRVPTRAPASRSSLSRSRPASCRPGRGGAVQRAGPGSTRQRPRSRRRARGRCGRAKLGHVVIGSRDQEASQRFFTEGLGFKVSDHVRAWRRSCAAPPTTTTSWSSRPRSHFLHHTSWQVDDVDEVGRGATAMLEGHPERHVWGLGRHHIGSNFFWYLKDPAGNFSEYYSRHGLHRRRRSSGSP